MGIEGFNRFQWIVIGCVLGVLIGVAWSLSQDTQGEGDQLAFETDVVQKDPQSTNPLIKSIIIHPSEVNYQGKTITLVSYKHLAKSKIDGKLWWVDRHFIADTPFKAHRSVAGMADPEFTVQNYLTELAKQPDKDFIKFTYGWWYVPSRAILAGAIGGTLLIGGLWPTLLGLMIGAGFGRRISAEEKKRIIEEKAKEKANSLWRYKSKSAPAPSGASNRSAVTAEDRAELEAVANAYEKAVGANAVTTSSPTATATRAQATTQDVKKLDTGALQEVAKTAEEQEEAELKMREYYPTVVRHKKDEKKEHDGKKDGPSSNH